jgi:hypothetical protein
MQVSVVPVEVPVGTELDILGEELIEKIEDLTWDHHPVALEALPIFESEIENSLE